MISVMDSSESKSSRGLSLGGGLAGALVGGGMGTLGGHGARVLGDRQAAKRLAQAPLRSRVLSRVSSGANRAARIGATGMIAGGGLALLPMLATGGLAPVMLPVPAALAVAGAGLAGLPLMAAGAALDNRMTARRTARKAKFLRRGGRLGAAAGAITGATMLAKSRKKPMEKKSSADLSNHFMRGFANELVCLHKV